jgi:glycosyltransferase involved in cell wall biosynthesis
VDLSIFVPCYCGVENISKMRHELFPVVAGLAIVVPCYNEVENVPKTLNEFIPVAAELTQNHALEALACGTPVVAANSPSIPEIVGEAALLIEADNIEAMARAIIKLLSDQDLRATLIEKGLGPTPRRSMETGRPFTSWSASGCRPRCYGHGTEIRRPA